MNHTSIVAIITAIIVALATLILQKSFNNVISGVMLFITCPFKKGDKVHITYNGNEIASGYISRKGIMKTKMKTYDRDICIIANSVLDNCVIINSDIKDGTNRPEKLKFTLDSNIDKIKCIILETLIKNQLTTNTVDNTNIIVRYENGCIGIQYNVRALSTEESYIVCSDICEHLIKVFNRTSEITLV